MNDQSSAATADDLRAVYDAFCVSDPDAKWMSPTAAMIRAILNRYDVVPKGTRDAAQQAGQPRPSSGMGGQCDQCSEPMEGPHHPECYRFVQSPLSEGEPRKGISRQDFGTALEELASTARAAIAHVGLANYAHRETEAQAWIREKHEQLLAASVSSTERP